MTQEHPVVERYMSRLEASISDLDAVDRREIVQDIRDHIAEATAQGKPLAAVLESLGSANALARAYAIELALHPRTTRRLESFGGFFRVAGLVGLLSLTTFIVVTTLGSIVIAFVASGVVVFAIGLFEAANIHLPGVQTAGLAPIWFILLGPVLLVVGVVALVGLRRYVRFIARALRTILPRHRNAAGTRA